MTNAHRTHYEPEQIDAVEQIRWRRRAPGRPRPKGLLILLGCYCAGTLALEILVQVQDSLPAAVTPAHTDVARITDARLQAYRAGLSAGRTGCERPFALSSPLETTP
jgi:hypothetical protein